MRRVRRSVQSKLHAENTAHPLSQLILPPRAPAALPVEPSFLRAALDVEDLL